MVFGNFKFLLYIAGLAVLIGLVTKKSYPVHSEGIVVISGASTGIGRHASEHLAASGYTVYCGVRKQSDADRIISMKNDKLIPLMMDVTNHDSLVNAMDTVSAAIENSKLPFVALVNNAGVSRRVVAEFHDLSDVRRVFDTNVFGLMDLTQLSLPLLRESRGRIVMISSVAGSIAMPGSSTYSASKFAVEAYSDALRREVAGFNISVSVIKPAYVKSAIFASGDAASAQVYEEEDASEEVSRLYPSLVSEAAKASRRNVVEKASEPIVTSDAILHAISSAQPQTRYTVANVGGIPASILEWVIWILPDRVIDMLYASK